MRLSLIYRLLDSLLLCQFSGQYWGQMVGIIRVYILWRWRFFLISRRLHCHGAQTSQVPIFREQSNGIRVNANIAVVDVVSQQPCMEVHEAPQISSHESHGVIQQLRPFSQL